MSKALTEVQRSAIRKEGDDLIEALHQVEEKHDLTFAMGLAEGYIKGIFACGLIEKIGYQNMASRLTDTHNAVAKKKGWFTSFS